MMAAWALMAALMGGQRWCERGPPRKGGAAAGRLLALALTAATALGAAQEEGGVLHAGLLFVSGETLAAGDPGGLPGI